MRLASAIALFAAAGLTGGYFAYQQSVTPVNVPPMPRIVPTGTNGWWRIEWNPGSESSRTNYTWFIWSTTNLLVPLQDEPQQWDGDDLIFRPQPNYFFGLHGVTNSL
jgi:hypothetical protein